ncbi:major tail protein [Clostridium thermarum]|uniref:major tail protein n=1 Tax=Clostridium thermarum TaxID=1716543 RepID=UPI001122C7C8|nr:major tail protein [Clostridium thermarum]
MAVIGLKYPVYAPLTENENGTFEYGTGKVAAKAIKVDMSLDISESKLYADDNEDESVKEFRGGKMTFTANDLETEVKKDWLANTTETVTVGNESVEVLVSKDTDTPGYFGFGFIVSKIVKNVRKYRAVIYTKVKFSEPNESTETKGQQVNFQTPTIEGSLSRRMDGQWKREVTVDSLALAKAWLAKELNLS